MGRLTLTVILALTSAAAAAAAAAAPPVCSRTHATIWEPTALSLAGHIGLQAAARGCRQWHIGLQAVAHGVAGLGAEGLELSGADALDGGEVPG